MAESKDMDNNKAALSEDGEKLEREKKLDKRLNVVIVVLSVLIVLTVCYNLCFKTISVKQTSMNPTIEDGEVILLRRGSANVKRGDIVVFLDENVYSKRLVKRVIGVGGDRLSIGEDGILTVTYEEKGKTVTKRYDEVYVAEGNIVLYNIVVPEGKIFVLGDNRLVSFDSQEFGSVAADSVEGVMVFPSYKRATELP